MIVIRWTLLTLITQRSMLTVNTFDITAFKNALFRVPIAFARRTRAGQVTFQLNIVTLVTIGSDSIIETIATLGKVLTGSCRALVRLTITNATTVDLKPMNLVIKFALFQIGGVYTSIETKDNFRRGHIFAAPLARDQIDVDRA